VSVDKRQDEVNAREYLMGAAFGLLTVDDPTQATHLEKYQGSLNYHPRRRAYYVDYSFAMSEAIKRWMRELNSELAFARAA